MPHRLPHLYFQITKLVKNDSNIKRWRLLGLLFIAIGLFDFAVGIGSGTIAHGTWIQVGDAALFALLGVVYIAVYARRAQQHEERRHSAALAGIEGSARLARPQPEWDAGALPLPTSLSITVRWRKAAVVALMMTLVLWIFVFLFTWIMSAWLFPDPTRLHVAWISVALFCVLYTIIMVPAMLFAMARRQVQRIEVTDRGLTVIKGKKVRSIRWEDAQIFAIVAPYGYGSTTTRILWKRKPAPPVQYELSGADSIVKWTRIARKPVFSLLAPDRPWDEFNRAMDALLSVIAARTQLPLFDLRAEPKRRLPEREPAPNAERRAG